MLALSLSLKPIKIDSIGDERHGTTTEWPNAALDISMTELRSFHYQRRSITLGGS